MTLTRRGLQDELADLLGSPAEARFIVEEVAGRSASGAACGPEVATRAHRLAERRLAGEPLQYVLGHWAFRSLELAVDPRVLIPRPETEQVVEVALAQLAAVVGRRRDAVVVDLGTGSGAVALAIAGEALARHRGLRVWATDRSADALAVAEANRAALGEVQPAAAERVTLCRGAWWDALPRELAGHVDLVVANPPYVGEGEWAYLPPEVRHEPRGALVAADGSDGTPGLADIEAVVAGLGQWLARPGAAVVELSPHQAEAAQELARRTGADAVAVERDLAGRLRALVARFG